jgi:hypothetical protein
MDASTGLTAYAVDTVVPADVFSDAGFRAAVKQLDDNDVPMDQRFLVVPPSVVQTIRGIDRYNSSDFVSGQPVANGNIGITLRYRTSTFLPTALSLRQPLKTVLQAVANSKQVSWVTVMQWYSQSKWVFVHKLSTSKSTWVICSQQTLSTVFRYCVLSQLWH